MFTRWTSNCFWNCLLLLRFLFNFSRFLEELQKVASLKVNGAILLQLSLDFIKYSLPIIQQGNQYPQSTQALATLWQISAICKSVQNPLRILSGITNSLWHPQANICQMVASAFKHHVKKVARGLPLIFEIYATGLFF
jgi:hypothetical protein